MSDLPPSGWTIATIGSLCQLINGRAFKPTDWKPEGLPIIRIQNLNNLEAPFNRYPGDFDPKHLVKDGDLLFAWSGTPGTSFGAHVWTRGKAILNQHIFRVIHDKKRIDRDFFKLAINFVLEELIFKAHGGAGLAHITKGRFEETAILLPPLPEQRRIVARIEALFARTRRARADLERIAPLSARHRRSILAREYEGEQAGSPAQHQLVPLADCVRDFTYGTAAKCSHDVDGIPVLRIPNVAAGRISIEDMKFAVLPEREHRKLALEEGDILIVRSNGSPELVGRPALVEQTAAGMAFAGYLIRARPRRERVEPAYLLHMLSSPNVRGIVELNARSSSGVHNINAAELAALKVPLPSLDEQKCAVRRIELAAAHALVWEADAARSLALLDRLEQSILARAFRGELVPQEPGGAADSTPGSASPFRDPGAVRRRAPRAA